jgi:uncharacterized protein
MDKKEQIMKQRITFQINNINMLLQNEPNKKSRSLTSGALLILFSFVVIANAQAASFDCTKTVSKIEKMICEDTELSKLDEEMLTVYQKTYHYTADPAELRLKQKQWIKYRDTCKEVRCVTKAYHSRLTVLQTILSDPQPCFRLLERKWPEVASGNYPVCRDFLYNINMYCSDLPICGWKVDPSAKSLSLPSWEELDPKTHLKLIQHMFQQYFSNPEEKWHPIPQETLKWINEGRTRLQHARIDLGTDAKNKHVVRFDSEPCNRQTKDFYGVEVRVAVVDDSLSRVDSRYEYLGTGGMGFILHNGLTYVITRNGNGFAIQEPFSSGDEFHTGMRSVCVFDYLKR